MCEPYFDPDTDNNFFKYGINETFGNLHNDWIYHDLKEFLFILLSVMVFPDEMMRCGFASI